MQHQELIDRSISKENNEESTYLEDKLLSTLEIKQFIKAYLHTHEASLQQSTPPLDPRWFFSKTYQDYIAQIPYLTHWVQHPFVLSLVMQVLPQVATKREEAYLSQEKESPLTIASLYDAFIADWLVQQADHLVCLAIPLDAGYHKKALAFTKALAMKMAAHGITSIDYLPRASREEDDEWDIFFSDIPLASDQGNPKPLYWRKICCQLGPFIHRENHYAFLHPTLLDYFVARGIFEASKLPSRSLNASWPPVKTITDSSPHAYTALSVFSSPRATRYTPSSQGVSVRERIAAYEAASIAASSQSISHSTHRGETKKGRVRK